MPVHPSTSQPSIPPVTIVASGGPTVDPRGRARTLIERLRHSGPFRGDQRASPSARDGAIPDGELPQQFKSVPSWLTSLVFHLLTLIALGIFQVSPIEKGDIGTLVVSMGAPADGSSLGDFVLAPQSPAGAATNIEMAVPQTAVESNLAELPEISSVLASEQAAAGGSLDLLGDLLGSNGGGGAGGGGQGQGGIGNGAQFFDVRATGNRFVFIVDSSSSMTGKRLAYAKQELLYAIGRLERKQFFYVIFFNHYTHRMFVSEKRAHEPRLVPATQENVRRLQRWMLGIEAQANTEPLEAFQFALDLNPDAIFLLTDGEFSDGGQTVEYLRNHNLFDDPIEGRRPKTIIHTIGFFSRQGEPTLQSIAEEHRGTYRFVDEFAP